MYIPKKDVGPELLATMMFNPKKGLLPTVKASDTPPSCTPPQTITPAQIARLAGHLSPQALDPLSLALALLGYLPSSKQVRLLDHLISSACQIGGTD